MRHSGLRFSILVLVLMSVLGGVVFRSPPPASVVPAPAAVHVLHIPRPTLADIRKRGVLSVLMHHDVTSYFLYRGQEHGFEYELALGFAQQLGVSLQVRTPPPGVALTQWLIEGKGDIAAGVFVPDGGPSARVRYSQAHMATDIQIITRADQPHPPALPHTTHHGPPEALHTNAVPAEASARPDSGLKAAAAPPSQVLLSADLSGLTLSATVKKRVPFAPAPTPVVELVHTAAPGTLRSVYTLPEPARIGWSVRAEHSELLAAVNQYHAQTKRSGLRKILYEKYFTTTRFLRSDESTVFSSRLSQYDPLIARYAEQAGFDWRLIAALIFEESRFDHTRRSPRDAYGLMQVTEVAAREVGVDDFLTLHGNLEAGVRYLQFLLQQFPDGQTQDRLALALSGYLLGPRRVRAAQRLAHALGYDPYCWKDSVEAVFPLLEDSEYYRQVNASFIPGGEAVRYVNAILKRYELYTCYIPREPPAAQTAQSHPPVLSVAEPTG